MNRFNKKLDHRLYRVVFCYVHIIINERIIGLFYPFFLFSFYGMSIYVERFMFFHVVFFGLIDVSILRFLPYRHVVYALFFRFV